MKNHKDKSKDKRQDKSKNKFEIIHKENPIVHINYLLSFAEMRQINMYYLEPVFLLNNSICYYKIC